MEDVCDETAVGGLCVERPTENSLQVKPELTILSREEPVATCAYHNTVHAITSGHRSIYLCD